MTYLRRLLVAPATRPATTVYIGGVLFLIMLNQRWIELGQAMILFALATLLVIISALHREIATVHFLVNSQHDQFTARIDQLIAALVAANVQVPEEIVGGDHTSLAGTNPKEQ